ncbi:MAG: glycoside hydrolase family 11 protein [Lachnospiraceae bacterium]|jgi:hypothetical protein|nr:glycoside hydrolase family 11 protein [Lachnospiraceae bacterium]
MKKTSRRLAWILAAALVAAFLPSSMAVADEDEAEGLFIDFEDGTPMGFDVRGSAAERDAGTGVLTVVTEEAHSGQYSLLIDSRRSNWNGPQFNVAPFIEPGETYDISIWVLPKTPNSISFVLSTQIGEGGAAQYINLQSKTVSRDEGWTQLRGSYTYQGEDFISVYVESTSAADEFYIDDFSFILSGTGPWDLNSGPVTNNKRWSFDGFDFEYWSQDNSGDGRMILAGGGSFICDWDGHNILFRSGKRLGSTHSFHDFGVISIEYGAEHNINRGDVSYLTVYGWTEDPLIEFYIVENHGNYKPPGGVGYKGSYELDGGVYELYVDTRVEQPSIQGTKTFDQYFAVRVDNRKSGTISVSKHFAEWELMGLDMSGVLYEVMMCIEGFRSAGNGMLYTYILTLADEVIGGTWDEISAIQLANAEDTEVTEEVVADEPVVDSEPDVDEEANTAEPVADTETASSRQNSPLLAYLLGGLAILGIVGAVSAILIFIARKNRG